MDFFRLSNIFKKRIIYIYIDYLVYKIALCKVKISIITVVIIIVVYCISGINLTLYSSRLLKCIIVNSLNISSCIRIHSLYNFSSSLEKAVISFIYLCRCFHIKDFCNIATYFYIWSVNVTTSYIYSTY